MDEVKKWLAGGGTFSDGIALLVRYPGSRSKAARIVRSRNKTLLRKELMRLARVKPPRTAPRSGLVKPAGKVRIQREDLPRQLQTVWDEAAETHRLMRSVHEKMKLASTDQQRETLRAELVRLEDVKNRAWAVIDHWKATGELPALPQDPPPPVDNYNTVPAARLAVSRWIKALDTETDPQKIGALKAKIGPKVEVILNAGGTFSRLEEPLKKHGFLPQ